MTNRHEFNLYLNASHQFNTNLSYIHSYNTYLNILRSFNLVIDDFHADTTLSARFIQILNDSISGIGADVNISASFVNTSKMEINESSLLLTISPNIGFNIIQNMSGSPTLSQDVSESVGFINTQKFESILTGTINVYEQTSSSVVMKMENTNPTALHYFLVSYWDSYSGSVLDTKQVNEMEYEIA